ncbi:MAG: hypothetical protein HC795_12460 [Coleofasciculaceae cyanobacterium RL_1_1]|nr:hypothetical protein [Coleofasciculaceae cyanobacterium RL_1_1]
MPANEPPTFNSQNSEPDPHHLSTPSTDVFKQTSPSQIEVDLTISRSSYRADRYDQPLPFSAIVLALISLVAIITAVYWVSGMAQDKSNQQTPKAQATIFMLKALLAHPFMP